MRMIYERQYPNSKELRLQCCVLCCVAIKTTSLPLSLSILTYFVSHVPIRLFLKKKSAFQNMFYKSASLLYTLRELADFPHCFFFQVCFREIIFCTYACRVKRELGVANSLCFLLVMKMGSTRVNLFMEKNRLMCICVQREIYQMWQHFAECGIALCTTRNINVRFFSLKICAYLYPYAKYTSRADIQNVLIEYMSGGEILCEKVKLSLHLRDFEDLACYLLFFW